MSEKGRLKKIHVSRRVIVVAVIVVAAAAVVAAGAMGLFGGSENVEFHAVEESSYPAEMTGQVIPEYRSLERALACMIEGKVYVLVTRGEKPTSGFDIAVDRIVLEQDGDTSNLVVYADFMDPEPGTALAQVLNYPLQVVETALTELPNQIELRVQYKQ